MYCANFQEYTYLNITHGARVLSRTINIVLQLVTSDSHENSENASVNGRSL